MQISNFACYLLMIKEKTIQFSMPICKNKNTNMIQVNFVICYCAFSSLIVNPIIF